MQKKYLPFLLLPLILLSQNVFAQEIENTTLKVPFTSEVPNGNWVKPWNNACEEASIIMTEGYYFGYETMSKAVAIKNMTPLFKIQDKIFGSNADTDAKRTAKLINDYTDATASIKDKPTIEEIKNELDEGRPVIALLNMKNIVNKFHRFRAGGSYYHVLVIIGYDETTKEFITNDNGNATTGAGYRFKYQDIMKNLHDFNHKTKRADGPARVLFTDSKVLFKEKNNPAVYLIKHNTKYPIASGEIFTKHGWKWKNIHVVDKKTLDKFKIGDIISY